VITLPRSAELSPARARIAERLEQEYETHSEHLATLLALRSRHRSGGAAAHSAATVGARRALADVAQALRRLAEGSYGQCEGCRDDIPLDDLELMPAARWCRACGAQPAF
jgi:RNA polymerase-binding transcription factor DksA